MLGRGPGYIIGIISHRILQEHCTAGCKTALRGTDLWLGYLNSNKCFIWVNVLFELIQFLYLSLRFWQKGIANLAEVIMLCGQLLHYWSNALMPSLVQNRKMDILKIWGQCLHYLQSCPEISCVTKRQQWPCWKPTIHITGLSIY